MYPGATWHRADRCRGCTRAFACATRCRRCWRWQQRRCCTACVMAVLLDTRGDRRGWEGISRARASRHRRKEHQLGPGLRASAGPAAGAPDPGPVDRAVDRAAEPRRVDEGLRQPSRRSSEALRDRGAPQSGRGSGPCTTPPRCRPRSPIEPPTLARPHDCLAAAVIPATVPAPIRSPGPVLAGRTDPVRRPRRGHGDHKRGDGAVTRSFRKFSVCGGRR